MGEDKVTVLTDQFTNFVLVAKQHYDSRRNDAQSNATGDLLRRRNQALRFTVGRSGQEIVLNGNGSEPSALWRVLEALHRLSELSANWDSYGSEPIAESAIRRTISHLHFFLRDETPEPSVVPTNDGGVQLEWHGAGVDIEAKFPPSAPISFFISSSDGEHEGAAMPDSSLLDDAFARMTGKK